ncbi:NUDIX domain-containing protein [Patescibacteria group bacterium]
MPERTVSKERFKITPSVYLILEREGKVLLMQRQNTGYEDGNCGLPSGHKESGEYPSEAMIREAEEEIGVRVNASDLECVHIMMRIRDVDSERVDLFFVASKWEGEPQNTEPEKCSRMDWFPIEELPDNTIPYIKEALQHWRNGIEYSEFGK